jgi:hypothetical protein
MLSLPPPDPALHPWVYLAVSTLCGFVCTNSTVLWGRNQNFLSRICVGDPSSEIELLDVYADFNPFTILYLEKKGKKLALVRNVSY